MRQNSGTSHAGKTEMPYEKFRKIGPPEFMGSTNTFVSEEWKSVHGGACGGLLLRSVALAFLRLRQVKPDYCYAI
ncbi:hypothetical protein F511_13418 [Dorcoceras hygrometricum]|uniref:Uncharacterized protein n=1 Tax=Dorcoceras hygrometricum TaxID=472368 RepID=A0A2Z7BJE4_9LAMI|nr:hypothetical protein F511_13418 [Dorcoceras hygrometricum]